MGAPVLWKPRPVFTYVGIGSTSDRTTHPTIQQITRRPASHKEVRLHSEYQCLQALTHELPLRQKPRRGQRNLARVAKSEHRKDLIFDCYFFWQQSPFLVTLLVSFAYRSWILLWKRLYFSKVWRTCLSVFKSILHKPVQYCATLHFFLLNLISMYYIVALFVCPWAKCLLAYTLDTYSSRTKCVFIRSVHFKYTSRIENSPLTAWKHYTVHLNILVRS